MRRTIPVLLVAGWLAGAPGSGTVLPSLAEDAPRAFRTIEIGVPDMH